MGSEMCIRDSYSKLNELDGYRRSRSKQSDEEKENEKYDFIRDRFSIILDGILFVPRLNFPSFTEYGIRTEELKRVVQSVDSKKEVNSIDELQSRERNTLLVLLATMCQQASFDYTQRGISKAIEAATEEMGVRAVSYTHLTLPTIYSV